MENRDRLLIHIPRMNGTQFLLLSLSIWVISLFFHFQEPTIPGRPDEIQSYFSQGLSAQEKIPLPLVRDFNQGLKMINQSQFSVAAVQLGSLLQRSPSFHLARAYLSDTLYFSGRWEEALHVAAPLPDLLGQQRARLLRRKFLGGRGFSEDSRYVLLSKQESPLAKVATQLGQPAGLSLNSENQLWVADNQANTVFLAGFNGGALRQVNGSWFAGLRAPIAAVSDNNGSLFVSTFGDDQISIFNNKGRRERTFGGTGNQAGLFFGPRDLVLDDQRLFVLDIGNHRVQKFTLAGDFLSTFAQDDLRQPTSISIDSQNAFLYVADRQQKSILVFGKHGRKLKEYGKGILRDPRAVYVHKGFLFVADQKLGIVFLRLSSRAQGTFLHNPDTKNRVSARPLLSIEKENWIRLLTADGFQQKFGKGVHAVQDMVIDENNIVYLIFSGEKHIVTLVPQQTRYRNLEVRISRMRTQTFPRITLEVTVQDAGGRFLSSLATDSFSIYENNGKISNLSIENISALRQPNTVTFVREDTPFFQKKLAGRFTSTLEEQILPMMRRQDFSRFILAPPNFQPPQLVYEGRGKRDILYYANRFIWEHQTEDSLSLEVIDPTISGLNIIGTDQRKEEENTGQSQDLEKVFSANWPIALQMALKSIVQNPNNNGNRNLLLVISGRSVNLPENMVSSREVAQVRQKLVQLQRMAKVHQIRVHILSYESEENVRDRGVIQAYFQNFAKKTNGMYFAERNTSSRLSFASVFRSHQGKQKKFLISYTSPSKAIDGHQNVRVSVKHLDIVGTMNTGYTIPR